MRGSLNVLDVWLLFVFDAAVGQFLRGDCLVSVLELTTSLPVPVQAAYVFEAGHFFIGKFGNDFEHLATVAVHAEDLVAEELLLEEDLLENVRADDEAANNPFSRLGVLPQ